MAPSDQPARRRSKATSKQQSGPSGAPARPNTPWIAPAADLDALKHYGLKVSGGGPHQSKTMMLQEISTLLAANAERKPNDAIVVENLLGKQSARAREATAYRLHQLYGVGELPPSICLAFFALWRRDPPGRPLLALLCALARDPSLRDGASAVLDAPVGEQVRWPAIALSFEAKNPGRLGAKTAKSLAQNAASSWTQAGFLAGAVRKARVRAKPTPMTAAYAALLGTLSGFGGPALLESPWLDILDRPIEARLALLRQAEGLGLVRVRAAGDVMEIETRSPMAAALELPDLVNG